MGFDMLQEQGCTGTTTALPVPSHVRRTNKCVLRAGKVQYKRILQSPETVIRTTVAYSTPCYTLYYTQMRSIEHITLYHALHTILHTDVLNSLLAKHRAHNTTSHTTHSTTHRCTQSNMQHYTLYTTIRYTLCATLCYTTHSTTH